MEAATTCCPVCGGEATRSIPGAVARFVQARTGVESAEGVRSNFCTACEHVFMTPFLTRAQLARLYTGYRGVGYNSLRFALEPGYRAMAADFDDPNGAYHVARRKFYDFALADLRDHPGRVVDFGGGDGGFSRYAFPAAEITVADEDYERKGGDLQALLSQADLLFCAHVFEHLPQPWEEFSRLTAPLRPGSLVYVEVPQEYPGTLKDSWEQVEQRDAAGARTIGSSLQLLHEHLAHFSRRSLAALMERGGVSVRHFFHSDSGWFAALGHKL